MTEPGRAAGLRATLAGVEFVYGSVIRFARGVFRYEGLRFDRSGSENLPANGGAVVVINHTGYMDFTYAGYAAHDIGRYIRFMAKKEVFDNKISGPLMRAMKHIPVDRGQGGESYRMAVDYLRAGELVGVFPEATISRSFELKDFKLGAARMALEADVPIVPVIIWGSQRVWTKGHPKNLGRTKTPITIRTGAPIAPTGTPEELTAAYKAAMAAQLEQVRADYGPHPPGEYWVPASLGGGAPTLEEANRMDAEDAAAKAAARARRDAETTDGRRSGDDSGAAGPRPAAE